jgi:iron complex outermembrane receptor protein
VVYGVGQPGGLINIVTKKPRAEHSASVELRHSSYMAGVSGFGDDNSFGVSTDFTGPITSGGDLLYRIVLAHINAESYRHEVNDWSLYIHPSLTWNLSDATSATAQLEITTDKGRWDEYLVAPKNNLDLVPPVDTRLGEPTDYYWDGGYATSLQMRHRFSEDAAISASLRRVARADGRRLFQHGRMLNDSILSRSYRDQKNERDYNFADVNYQQQLITGPLEHTLVAGVSGGYEFIHFNRLSLATDSTLNINIYEPVYGAKIPVPKPGFNRTWNNLFAAAYLEDQIAIGELFRISAGVRIDRASIDHSVDYDPKRTGFGFEKTDVGFSPRVGLVALPSEGISVYVSYSTSFAPTDAEKENAQGAIDFEPTRGRQLELGTKADLFDGKLAAGLAIYQITQENVLNEGEGKNPNGNTIYVQVGQARSRGVDLELSVSPLAGVEITGGYGYTDARVTEDPDSSLIGARLTYTPHNQGNAWIAYRIPEGVLKGLGFGFGLVHIGSRPTKLPDADGFAFHLPAYTRYDGALYWERDAVKISLNLNNLTGVRYWASGEAIRLVPGAPASIRTTITITP